jgi:phenylacetate-CoA ligase
MQPVPLTPLEPWITAKIGAQEGGLTRETLRSYQLERLNQTLSLAQSKSAFYRRHLGPAELCLGNVQDLTRLPLTTAEHLRAEPMAFLCVSPNEVDRIVTLPTSGTTGPPKRVFFTARDQELTRDFFHHGMSTLVGPGDRVLILLPGSLPGSVGDLLKDGLARLGAEGIPHGLVTDPARTLDVIEAEQVTALVGVPVQVLQLARTATAGYRRRYAGLESVLLSTDRIPHAVVEVIEETWGCSVYNHYGTTEMGLGGGVDCRALAGYHLREADLLFEIVDPATGQPLPDGESGEVVFTTLTREAMPLIRYRTGDAGRFLPEPCACGTVLRSMAHIDDRPAAGLTLPGGDVLRQRDLDEVLFPLEGLLDFRAALVRGQDSGQDRATLILRVKCVESEPGGGSGRGGGSSGATPTPDRDEILRALREVVALSSPVARERISIDIRDWDAGAEIVLGTGKRKIEQMEEGGGAGGGAEGGG